MKYKGYGSSVIKGKEEGEFWVRTFGCQDKIALVQNRLQTEANLKVANVTIVSGYQVSDHLQFVYLIVLRVDLLGIDNASGIVFVTDKTHLGIAEKKRDKIADQVLTEFHKSHPVFFEELSDSKEHE